MEPEVTLPTEHKKFQARHWIITYHNPTVTGLVLNERIKSKCPYYSFQLEECPTTKSKHFQIYLGFEKPVRNSDVDKILQTENYWSTNAKYPQKCYEYCIKERTRLDGPWFSEQSPKKIGQRTDLEEAVELYKDEGIVAVRDTYPDTYSRHIRFFKDLESDARPRNKKIKKDVIIVWGSSRSGKTTWAREEYDCDPIEWNGNTWNGITRHDKYLIDEADDYFGDPKIKRSEKLKLLDHWEFPINIKHGHRFFAPSLIVLTSNKRPDLWIDIHDAAFRNRITAVFHYNKLPNGTVIISEESIDEYKDYYNW